MAYSITYCCGTWPTVSYRIGTFSGHPKRVDSFTTNTVPPRSYQTTKVPANSDQMCEKLGIKRVAMQERLRRAELRIISEFAESLP
ncbi:MAG: hypothetical protein ACXAEE_01485 [Candidatus Thorarchaeota archaeon]